MSEKVIIKAVQEILNDLPKLLGENYGVVEKELKVLLHQAESGESIERAVRRLLRQHESTRQWMEEWLKEIPPTKNKSFQPLPGDSIPPLVKDNGDNPEPK